MLCCVLLCNVMHVCMYGHLNWMVFAQSANPGLVVVVGGHALVLSAFGKCADQLNGIG